MDDGAPLDINFKQKTRLTPKGAKTIMPMVVGGQQIIPKNLIKPKTKPKKQQGKGKAKGKPKGGKKKAPTNAAGVPIYKLTAAYKAKHGSE